MDTDFNFRKNSDSGGLRRAENLQIVVAIGILTIAGTLYVNGMIDFPLLESVASITYVRTIFRYFIYTNVAFVGLKLTTITIYPFSTNNYVKLINDVATPFLYTFSPLLLIIGLGISIIFGQFSSDIIPVIAATGLSGLISFITSYYYYKRKQQFVREELEEILTEGIITYLISVEATEENRSSLSDLESLKQGAQSIGPDVDFETEQLIDLQNTVKQLDQNESVPLHQSGDEVWLDDIEKAQSFLDNKSDLTVAAVVEG